MFKTHSQASDIVYNPCSIGGNQSTFHQDHVEKLHSVAFRRQREYINMMISKTIATPSFATPACSTTLLDIHMM